MKNIIIIFASTCFLTLPTYSASFDCNKASSQVEKTICQNPELSELDDALATRYEKEVDKADEHKNDLRRYQLLWLKFQRNTCTNAECLIREHQERLGKTKGYGVSWQNSSELDDSDLPNNRTFGTFNSPIEISVVNPDNVNEFDTFSEINTLNIHSIKGKPYLAIVDSVLIFNNAHTCDITDKLATWSQNHWVLNDKVDENITELRLYPVINKNKVELFVRDIDNQYRATACGVDGFLDGLVFTSE